MFAIDDEDRETDRGGAARNEPGDTNIKSASDLTFAKLAQLFDQGSGSGPAAAACDGVRRNLSGGRSIVCQPVAVISTARHRASHRSR